MASTSLRATRKTYSFEDRRILISLINKHEAIEDKKSDYISICKRKSAWSLIAKEYNSLVGPQAARTAVQLRRCWENMKACKRSRDEKESRYSKMVHHRSAMDDPWLESWNQWWQTVTYGQNTPETSTSTGTAVGLPPNVVFEPTDSEPFTLQSVCSAKFQKLSCPKKDADSYRDLNVNGTFREATADENLRDAVATSRNSTDDCQERFMKNSEGSPTVGQSTEDARANSEPSVSHIFTSPSVIQQHNRKRKSAQQEDELHALALSEARMKVDIAAMLKEEARIKLEEAHYRKEEARLRMLIFTYKLDKVKED